MAEISGFPYFEVQFTKQGDLFEPAERQAVRDADLVWSANAGRYFVHGASKEAGDSAKVEAVAQCLRGR